MYTFNSGAMGIMITLTLASHQLSAELLYEESLQLIHTLQTESDIQAELPQPGTQMGAKGDPVTIGTIALTFISSGAAVALFKIIEAYLSKNSSLDFELEKADGSKLKLNASNLSSDSTNAVLAQLTTFLEKDNNG